MSQPMYQYGQPQQPPYYGHPHQRPYHEHPPPMAHTPAPLPHEYYASSNGGYAQHVHPPHSMPVGSLKDPNDPKAQAWASYYAKGGTDPTGFVFFVGERPPQPHFNTYQQPPPSHLPPQHHYAPPPQPTPHPIAHSHHPSLPAHSHSLPPVSSYPYQHGHPSQQQMYHPSPSPQPPLSQPILPQHGSIQNSGQSQVPASSSYPSYSHSPSSSFSSYGPPQVPPQPSPYQNPASSFAPDHQYQQQQGHSPSSHPVPGSLPQSSIPPIAPVTSHIPPTSSNHHHHHSLPSIPPSSSFPPVSHQSAFPYHGSPGGTYTNSPTDTPPFISPSLGGHSKALPSVDEHGRTIPRSATTTGISASDSTLSVGSSSSSGTGGSRPLPSRPGGGSVRPTSFQLPTSSFSFPSKGFPNIAGNMGPSPILPPSIASLPRIPSGSFPSLDPKVDSNVGDKLGTQHMATSPADAFAAAARHSAELGNSPGTSPTRALPDLSLPAIPATRNRPLPSPGRSSTLPPSMGLPLRSPTKSPSPVVIEVNERNIEGLPNKSSPSPGMPSTLPPSTEPSLRSPSKSPSPVVIEVNERNIESLPNTSSPMLSPIEAQSPPRSPVVERPVSPLPIPSPPVFQPSPSPDFVELHEDIAPLEDDVEDKPNTDSHLADGPDKPDTIPQPLVPVSKESIAEATSAASPLESLPGQPGSSNPRPKPPRRGVGTSPSPSDKDEESSKKTDKIREKEPKPEVDRKAPSPPISQETPETKATPPTSDENASKPGNNSSRPLPQPVPGVKRPGTVPPSALAARLNAMSPLPSLGKRSASVAPTSSRPLPSVTRNSDTSSTDQNTSPAKPGVLGRSPSAFKPVSVTPSTAPLSSSPFKPTSPAPPSPSKPTSQAPPSPSPSSVAGISKSPSPAPVPPRASPPASWETPEPKRDSTRPQPTPAPKTTTTPSRTLPRPPPSASSSGSNGGTTPTPKISAPPTFTSGRSLPLTNSSPRGVSFQPVPTAPRSVAPTTPAKNTNSYSGSSYSSRASPQQPSQRSNPQPAYHQQKPKVPAEPQSMALRLARMSLDEEEAEEKHPRPPVHSMRSSGHKRYIDLDDRPPESLRRSPSPGRPVPAINLPDDDDYDDDDEDSDEDSDDGPSIMVSPPSISVSSAPSIKVEVTQETSHPSSRPPTRNQPAYSQRPPPVPPSNGKPMSSYGNNSSRPLPPVKASASAVGGSSYNRPGLRCAGCDGLIVGRIVSAIGSRWHPHCFKCNHCGELLEHVSSYEHEGKAYCHLDYHELFAPRCYHCNTSIADERFITVTDEALSGGSTRYYHELHFFCAECGDPFLHPSASSAAPKGQKPRVHEDDRHDVGFTVYRGHPYCEACHVRLRMPKCTGCRKSIRDAVVEALGGKWHFDCFVCDTCKTPFDDPSFFQRGNKAFCDDCYGILLRNDL